MSKKCPRCESPSPSRHPCMGYEGEVETCTHPYHATDATEYVRADAIRKLSRELEAWMKPGGDYAALAQVVFPPWLRDLLKG